MTDTLPELPRRSEWANNRIDRRKEDRNLHLMKRVTATFADGDVRRAVRDFGSLMGLAPTNEATTNSLQLQHLPALGGFSFTSSPG